MRKVSQEEYDNLPFKNRGSVLAPWKRAVDELKVGDAVIIDEEDRPNSKNAPSLTSLLPKKFSTRKLSDGNFVVKRKL